jgi:hypothetical protein
MTAEAEGGIDEHGAWSFQCRGEQCQHAVTHDRDVASGGRHCQDQDPTIELSPTSTAAVSDTEARSTPAVRAVDGTRCTWLIRVLMSCLSSVAVVVLVFRAADRFA